MKIKNGKKEIVIEVLFLLFFSLRKINYYVEKREVFSSSI